MNYGILQKGGYHLPIAKNPRKWEEETSKREELQKTSVSVTLKDKDSFKDSISFLPSQEMTGRHHKHPWSIAYDSSYFSKVIIQESNFIIHL